MSPPGPVARGRLGFWLSLVLATACKPEPPPDFARSLATFRADYEASLSGPTGPRTAVAGHYVEPGHTLSLAEVGDDVIARPDVAAAADADAGLRVAVTDAAMTCERGCGPSPVPITDGTTTRLGSHAVVLSPQSGTLRVVVHRPGVVTSAVAWFEADPKWWIPAKVKATPDAEPELLATTRGLTKPMRPAGQVTAELPDGTDVTLVAYEAGPGRVMIPFTDATNGDDTYAVGRYLEAELAGDRVVLDFNRATNPWCAYSEHYNCPVPPAANAVSVPVPVGEKTSH